VTNTDDQIAHKTPRCNKVSATRLAWIAFYIGIAGYGGGPAIIGLIRQIFVDKLEWVSEEDFSTGLSLCQILPGANALSLIEFLGYTMRGSLGAIITPVCFLIPAFILMTVLSAVYFSYGQVPLAQALFTGLSATVVALLANALLILGKPAIRNWQAALIAATGFVVVIVLNSLHSPLAIMAVVACSALLGLLLNRQPGSTDGTPAPVAEPAPHTPWFWPVCLLLACVFVTILALTVHTAYTQLFLALSRVGLFTFGGGFMSIPFFQHEAVETHHWLTTPQFLAGIALGQITPGPVLITGTFIGYRVLGILGALLGTIAVFLPGALGMFFLAHQHERLQQLVWLQFAVRGVVAGFIGVLLNVTLQLARQSITDWKTAIVATVSLGVLVVARKDPLWVIIGTVIVSPFLFR